MKTKQQKEKELNFLHEKFLQSPNAMLVQFKGITVADDERLRREMREANLHYRVVKNTLALRAAKDTPLEVLQDEFTGSTAVALSQDDPVALAKVLSKWAKENKNIAFKAGVVEGRPLKDNDLEALSNMPSKEELISKVMFLINSGAQRLAVATAGVARNLAIVIDQVRAQKESQ